MAELIQETNGKVLIVRLPARMDAAAVRELEEPFAKTIADHNGPVLVDVSKVDFAASLALRMLMMNLKDQQSRGQNLMLFGLQVQIAEVFRKTRFDTLFTIADDEASGIEQLTA
ncbi:STAS domain-containing protein [Herpetosiphon sp. NSE202]|uniref:STAS domain-containing protein n=1 Tax=Herpetosiphon sp. NSE202 TaxID=3351349 RepID=UPI003628FA21